MIVLEKVRGSYYWHGNDGVLRADNCLIPAEKPEAEVFCTLASTTGGVLMLMKDPGLVVEVQTLEKK